MPTSTPAITVCIPTFNGPRYAKEIFDAIFAQQIGQSFEVLVVDSGSSDGTIELINSYPAIRLIHIPNDQFQHGRTRNLAAREARGEIVVYLTQSSTPVHRRWLANLTRHFHQDDEVGAVFGRDLPRSGCTPYVAFEIEQTFLWISPGNAVRKERLQAGERLGDLSPTEQDRRRFYSDVNSALRKSYWERHPYREVDYAEDQLFGADVLDHGGTKVYDPDASVLHSHDFPPVSFFLRRFDEFMALAANGDLRTDARFWTCVRAAAPRWMRLLRHVRAAHRYGPAARLGWLVGLGIYAMADQMALFLGARHHRLPAALVQLFSHERKLRRTSRARA